VGLVVLGIALEVLYHAVKAAGIGDIGAPTDIGGGLVPLAGYIAAAAGVVLLVLGFLDRRSRKR
jgi:hypothetical protein